MKNNRLIIVSYRLPFAFETTSGSTTLKASSGGLVTAMKSLDFKGAREKPVWVGCADFSRRTWEKHKHLLNDDFEYVPVFLDRKIQQDFYNGFSNSVIWPLFHYFTTYVDYQEKDFVAYQKANEAVSEAVAQLMKPQDIVWVHDYHFMGLPRLIREKKPDATIGFFLHIPFPSYELIRILPQKCKQYLLTGLLGADLVGFHTNDYNIHFLQSVQINLGVQHKIWKINYQNRLIQSDAFPVGINYSLYHDAYDNADVVEERAALKNAYKDNKIIFSVDRLDYTKGVMQRLDALEAFLQRYPEWTERLTFILVVVPSRDEILKYGERKVMIEQAVGRINGKYGTLIWRPIVYRYGSVPFPQLLALYTACDVALITPIRDGMNLVAKEFVAARKDHQGVLILSEMTGAANEMSTALHINPMDENEVADQMKIALEMEPEEQARRIAIMQRRLKEYDVKKWAGSFVESLLNMQSTQQIEPAPLLKSQPNFSLQERYAQARSRLLLLDYDGTLVNYKTKPELAAPPIEVINVLGRLASRRENYVVIISGRDQQTLDEWLGFLPIDMVAEHGSYIKQQGLWRRDILDDGSWKQIVSPVLIDFVTRCPGSFIEEKSHSLAWHYRSAESETGFVRSRELITTLENLLPYQLRVIDGNCVVEIKSTETDKGKVAKQLSLARPYDFVLAIGDDRTDEDMFTALTLENQYTVKVGPGSTHAAHRVENVQEVLALLKDFSAENMPL
ncbi:bifunctional alpha,alpha-trehalose-phosphate synthase (UDP-forming)/trehalose-phosphatase [Larkinella punicea]|uniref:Bifunctional alpha,alpha-trehalose-phosphate synthase (UDP-forming)/trehalose-phosphatase n=1 Tax=Larkinella punicea TaxID=2315727 RepID=A0A368JVE8_9BACT|nr:bifunctional alpha,alpha-trehalose-phosphate synthase (UDP-forming)/trehalose-phosphatase [Larkinella punicea]RCR71442.1 bifunctional alpha,alpha-trehalose-phosphate synthase (UDP-forming)/trehalose-phosphatase [Larkinella punicea]